MILSALPRVKGIIFLIIVSCLFCSSRAMADSTVAGTVKTVSGLVEIQRDADVFSARTGTEVMGQDILVTGVTGYAGIQFTDDTVITIGPGTVFRIDTYVFQPEADYYDFSFYMEKGEAIYNSGKIGRLSPESVNLTTPKATVGIRGTRFIMDVESKSGFRTEQNKPEKLDHGPR